jgi:hypothetical protein
MSGGSGKAADIGTLIVKLVSETLVYVDPLTWLST